MSKNPVIRSRDMRSIGDAGKAILRYWQ